MKKNYVELQNETVQRAEQYVRMVGSGGLLGVTLIGPAGMGKTRMVLHILEDELGLERGKDFDVYGGHITLAEIYEYLYENADKLVFFDDVSQVVGQPEIMELLKQALNVGYDQRVLNYRSKGVLTVKVPNRFNFTGRIIMAFNSMDKNNPNVKAILDRAPTVEIRYSHDEIIKGMYQIAKNEQGGISTEEKVIITRFIEKNTGPLMDVSFRKQQLAFNIYEACKKQFGDPNSKWQDQVLHLFSKKRESWIRELIKELSGDQPIKRSVLAAQIAIHHKMSPRNAQRKINEFLEIDEVFQDGKVKGGDIGLKPFV